MRWVPDAGHIFVKCMRSNVCSTGRVMPAVICGVISGVGTTGGSPGAHEAQRGNLPRSECIINTQIIHTGPPPQTYYWCGTAMYCILLHTIAMTLLPPVLPPVHTVHEILRHVRCYGIILVWYAIWLLCMCYLALFARGMCNCCNWHGSPALVHPPACICAWKKLKWLCDRSMDARSSFDVPYYDLGVHVG